MNANDKNNHAYAFIGVYDTAHVRSLPKRVFDDWMTIPDVAAYLGYNAHHVYALIREGRIRAARLFGVTVAHKDEVVRYQQERANRARQIQRLRREW